LGLYDFIDFGPAPRLICDHPMHADTHCGDFGLPTPLCIDRKRVTDPKQFQALFKSSLRIWFLSVFRNVPIFRKQCSNQHLLVWLAPCENMDDDGGLCTCLAHKSRQNNFQISISVFSDKFGLSSSSYQMVVVIGEEALAVHLSRSCYPNPIAMWIATTRDQRQHKFYSGVFS